MNMNVKMRPPPADLYETLHAQPPNVVPVDWIFDRLRLVSELLVLFKMVQRFRGGCIATAVGDTGFQLITLQLADDLAYIRVALESFRATRCDMLSAQQWQRLHGELNHMLCDLDARRYLENYRQQTVFLEELLEIIQRLARSGDYSVLTVADSPGGKSSRCFATADADRALIKLVMVEVLPFAEMMGRLRAIATYASVVDDPDPVLAGELDTFDPAIHRQLDTFRRDASYFQHYALKGIPSLVVRQSNETQLLQLVGMVKEGLINGRMEKPDSQQVFRLATEVIDVHLQIVEETLDYLTRKVQHSLLTRKDSRGEGR